MENVSTGAEWESGECAEETEARHTAEDCSMRRNTGSGEVKMTRRGKVDRQQGAFRK